jgi:hypothetical protein
VATWGNLANRMLSFAYKRFDGVVTEPGDPSSSSGQGLDAEDRALLEKVEAGFETVGGLYHACKFRAAPSVPSGQARARPWPWPARPTATDSPRSVQAWAKSELPPEEAPRAPASLFIELEEGVVEKEYAREDPDNLMRQYRRCAQGRGRSAGNRRKRTALPSLERVFGGHGSDQGRDGRGFKPGPTRIRAAPDGRRPRRRATRRPRG